MAQYASRTPQLVWERYPADLETPVAAMLKMGHDQEYAFLLESVEGGRHRGRYSAIGLAPDVIWRAWKHRCETCLCPQTGLFTPCQHSPLQSLRNLIEESRLALDEGMPPLAAGLFGYMGYGAIHWKETSIPDDNPDPLALPDALFVRPTIMIVFDNVSDELIIATPVRPRQDQKGEEAWEAAQTRIKSWAQKLQTRLTLPCQTVAIDPPPLEPVSNMSPEAYRAMVDQAKAYIVKGDIFQAVLSQRFSIPFSLPSFAFYRSLRQVNPSPFLFHFNFPDFSVIGSSPEVLVRLREREVTIRPIAGTRQRGKNSREDRALATELLNDPKELAEHLMLLDLGRNDVGRVAKPGSVRVSDNMVIERYSHVMHIVSNVIGDLASGMDCLDAFLAGFPAGTVSGAPKIRAMQIIEELEPERRGLYAGAIGYFSGNGDLDSCIALRTAIIKDQRLYVQAGGGVVADSHSESEYQETRNKARALFRAAHQAGKFPLPDRE